MADSSPPTLVTGYGAGPFEVPADQLQIFLESGYQPATPAETQDYLSRQRYSTPGQELETGLEAAGEAATFGLSTGVERAFGVEPADIEGRAEANPTAHMIGTGAGIIAPALLGDEAGLLGGAAEGAAEGAGALNAGLDLARGAAKLTAPSIASHLGEAVAKGVGAALPEASGTVSRIARQIVARGLGSAVEGGLYGLQEPIHEAMLGDPDVTAQSVLSDVGLSAALGGGLGAGLGLVQGAGAEAASKIREALASATGGAEERAAQSATALAPGAPADVAGAPSPTASILPDESLGSLLVRRRQDLLGAEQVAPGIGKALMVEADPARAALMLDNAGALGILTKANEKAAIAVAAADEPTARWMLGNAADLAKMEQRFPDTILRIPNMEPVDAQYLLEKWPLAFRGTAEREAAEKQLANGLQGVYDSTEDALTQANKGIFPAEAERSLLGHDPAAALDALDAAKATLNGIVEKMSGDPFGYDRAYLNRVSELSSRLGGSIGKIGEAAPERQALLVYETLGRLRQDLDAEIPYGKEPLSIPKSERETLKLLRGARGQVKAALTDDAVFGPQAARRAAIDDAQRTWIRRAGPKSEFRRRFMLQNDGKWTVDPAKIGTWMNGSAGNRGAVRTATWGRVVQAARDIADQLDASSPVADEEVATTAGAGAPLRRAVNEADENAAKAMERARVTAKEKTLHAEVQGASMPTAAAVKSGGLGHAPFAVSYAMPFPWGNIVRAGMAARRVVGGDAASRALVLGRIERAGLRTGAAVTRAASALVRGVGTGVRAGATAGAVSSLEFSSRRSREKLRQLVQMANDPTKLNDALVKMASPIHGAAPTVASATQVTATRALVFLRSKMPAPPAGRGPLAAPWQPSGAEEARFGRYLDAVENPAGVMKQAAAGTLTPEAVEALRAVHPALFDQMKQAVVAQIASHPRPPYASRRAIATLLGIDVDGSLRPASIQANQAPPASAPSSPAAKPSPGARHLTLGTRLATPTQRDGPPGG